MSRVYLGFLACVAIGISATLVLLVAGGLVRVEAAETSGTPPAALAEADALMFASHVLLGTAVGLIVLVTIGTLRRFRLLLGVAGIATVGEIAFVISALPEARAVHGALVVPIGLFVLTRVVVAYLLVMMGRASDNG